MCKKKIKLQINMIKQMWPLIKKSKFTSSIDIYLHFKLVNIRMNKNQINFLFIFYYPVYFLFC